MLHELYELYLSFFLNYPVIEKLFNDLLKPEKAHIIYRYTVAD